MKTKWIAVSFLFFLFSISRSRCYEFNDTRPKENVTFPTGFFLSFSSFPFPFFFFSFLSRINEAPRKSQRILSYSSWKKHRDVLPSFQSCDDFSFFLFFLFFFFETIAFASHRLSKPTVISSLTKNSWASLHEYDALTTSKTLKCPN